MDIFTHERGHQTGLRSNDLSTLVGGSSVHCLKCDMSLHAGGKANCPWNGVSDAQAKKNANKVIHNMAYLPLSQFPMANSSTKERERKKETMVISLMTNISFFVQLPQNPTTLLHQPTSLKVAIFDSSF
jgi:hypothetical protein